jgi:neutral ceramidase
MTSLVCGLLLLAKGVSPVAAPAAPALQLYRAQVEITPPEPLPLGGFTARAGKLMEPGGEPLYARALVLRSAGLRIGIIAVDMLTIPESLVREVRSRLQADVQLFLVATHTHCAPDSQMLNERMTIPVPGIATFRRTWLEWYADRISSSVTEALAQPPAETGSLSVRRFYPGLNNHRRRGWAPERAATTVSAGERRLFLSYPAHAVICGPEINRTSGDWPGHVAEDLGLLVLPGAIGGVSPRYIGDTTAERMDNFTRLMREGFQEARPEHLGVGRLTWAQVPLPLERPVPHPEFAPTHRVPEPLAAIAVNSFAPKEAWISAFSIGELAVIGVPGEPTPYIGRRIAQAGAAFGFRMTLVISNVNGWMGYILDDLDYDRGGYEATVSFFGRDQGDRVISAAHVALLRLYEGLHDLPGPKAEPGKRATIGSTAAR